MITETSFIIISVIIMAHCFSMRGFGFLARGRKLDDD